MSVIGYVSISRFRRIILPRQNVKVEKMAAHNREAPILQLHPEVLLHHFRSIAHLKCHLPCIDMPRFLQRWDTSLLTRNIVEEGRRHLLRQLALSVHSAALCLTFVCTTMARWVLKLYWTLGKILAHAWLPWVRDGITPGRRSLLSYQNKTKVSSSCGGTRIGSRSNRRNISLCQQGIAPLAIPRRREFSMTGFLRAW